MSAPGPDTHYKALLQPVQPHLISICPTMDLVAAVTAHNQLEVFRFDGQRAFGWRRGTAPLQISALQWSAEGAHIVLAWSDDTLEIVDAKLGKVILHYPLAPPKLAQQPALDKQDDTTRSIKFVGCGMNLLDATGLKVRPAAKTTAVTRPIKSIATQNDPEAYSFSKAHASEPTLEDFTARVLDPRRIEPEGEATNLPLQLVQMDVEAELPQLSALPQVEDPLALDFQADRFSTQELIDWRLPLSDNIAGPAASVPIQLAFTDDGILTSSIYRGFFAGAHRLDASTRGQVVAHASHPFSSIHVLLESNIVRAKQAHQNINLTLQTVDYQAVCQSKHFLHLVYTKASNILELSRYINLTIVCIRAAWETCQSLPQRWLSNGSEMFEPEHKIDLISAMYRLIVSGDCHPLLKQWITDDIGERNHKRWDATVVANYTKIIELVQRHLLPALDRTTIVASRLRALARTPGIPAFKLDERHLSRILHDVDILRLIAHRVLQHARLEAIQFATFSTWLATQTALQAAEPESSTAQELAETAAEIDPAPLLDYILGAMTRSKLNFFLSRASREVVDAPRRPQQQIRSLPLLAQILDRQSDKAMQPGTQPGVVEIVDLLYQALFLGDSVREVYAVVPAGLAKGTIIGKPIDVCPHNVEIEKDIWDVRIVYDPDAADDEIDSAMAVYTLHTVRSENPVITVQKRRLSSSVDSTLGDATSARIRLAPGPRSANVIAVKFLDDQDLVALLVDSKANASWLIRVCYRGIVEQSSHKVQEATAMEVMKEWDHTDNFKPRHLVVSREKERVRCVCLDEGRRRYAVVALRDNNTP